MNENKDNNLYKVAYLELGSDIDPQNNVVKAIEELRKNFKILAKSRIWESAPVGRQGSKFLNSVVAIETKESFEHLKNILRQIEKKLGRVRSQDKNAPRQIDIDILIYADEIYDPDVWTLAYLAVPLAEVFPDLINPINGSSIEAISSHLKEQSDIYPREDIS